MERSHEWAGANQKPWPGVELSLNILLVSERKHWWLVLKVEIMQKGLKEGCFDCSPGIMIRSFRQEIVKG
jgi:hypothetical protein